MTAHLQQQDLNRAVAEFITPVDTYLQAGWTIDEALAEIRRRDIQSSVVYFYVVDSGFRLVGVLPSRKLLLADPKSKVGEVMDTPVISLPQTATLAEAMEEFALRRLLALPVVDSAGRLLGIIDVQLYAEEAVDLAEVTRVADLFQLMGISVQQLKKGAVWPSFRVRVPWLVLNIISGLTCAAIAFVFKEVLDKVLVLAMFIPLVLTVSESVSMQSMTLTLQFLHGIRSPLSRLGSRFSLEGRTALLLGAACATIVGLAATFWPGGAHAVGVIMLSIVVAMTVAAVLGTVLPIVLHSVKLDPRVAAGPVVLMIVDMLTTAVYLGLATLLLI